MTMKLMMMMLMGMMICSGLTYYPDQIRIIQLTWPLALQLSNTCWGLSLSPANGGCAPNGHRGCAPNGGCAPNAQSVTPIILPDARSCCKNKCIETLSQEPSILKIQASMGGSDKEDQTQWLFNHLVSLLAARQSSDDGLRRNGFWKLGDHEVCYSAFCKFLGMGQDRVRRILTAVEKGERPCPDEDQRRYNQGRDPAAARQVEAFLEFAYHNLAEPLADVGDAQDDPSKPDIDSDGELILPSSGEENKMTDTWFPFQHKDTRYLHPGRVEDFYDTYVLFERFDTPSSLTTFKRVFKKWRSQTILKFRGVCQHAKCSICVKLQIARKRATTLAEREHHQQALNVHLRGMFLDRAFDAKFAKLSEESANGNLVEGSVLSIAMDGMDQAKFKVPRNTVNSKDLEPLWRPVLHMTGLIVEGIGEFYQIAESDCKKNSDMNIQCLSHILDKVRGIFQSKLLVVPQHLVLLTDNTTREQKNQFTMLFAAYLVASEKIQSVTNNFFRVGHTHMKLDQRFSVAASRLKATQVLQTPGAFLTHLRNTMTWGNRITNVELNPGAWNWKLFLEPVNINISGLASTALNPDVCHTWRFVRRQDLHQHVPREVADMLVVP